MKDIIFLAHRIPYPPSKGDKIRAFHMLKWLSERYIVHLGAFVDDRQDWAHKMQLEKLCASMCLRPLNPLLARVGSLRGLVTGEPLTLPYYRDGVMRGWINTLFAGRSIHAVVVYSACMAQYAAHASVRRIIDFVDLDSDKWRQFAETQAWPWSWLYRREARRLAIAEMRIAEVFDAGLFVSPAELGLFAQSNPVPAARCAVMQNGVDTLYFSPQKRGANPYTGKQHVITFTGAMDYWPNVDAVTWFAQDVLPNIRTRIGDVSFFIVGAKPTRAVLALGKLPGVQVTGAVSDVRPYIGHAAVIVAPLRIARGVQNKVLEAMAMARPVIMTPAARKGLAAGSLIDTLVAADAHQLATKTIEHLEGLAPVSMGEQARAFVQRHYNWTHNLQVLGDVIEGDQPQPYRVAEAI